MAKLYRWMWIFVALYLSNSEVYSTSSSLFDRILNEADPCKESCDKTYPLHTYPNPRHAECCKRGCRFYSLVEFINKSQDENATRDACMASCMEAYSPTGDRYACNIGCANQVPFISPSNSLELSDDDVMVNDEWSSMNLLKPFMYVHSMYNNVVDHVVKVVSLNWSFYMREGDGQIVVVQTEPEMTEFVDIDDAEDKGKDDESVLENGEMAGNKMESSDQSSNFFYHRQLTPNDVASEDLPIRITVNAYATEEIKSLDWLGCVSKKSGLPRWLLGLVIFVSAMVMVWLCFATTATAPEQHIKPQVLSIYGDGDYVKIEKPDVKIKPYYDEESDEAALLPVKVHLSTV